jgi:hypothetical protein
VSLSLEAFLIMNRTVFRDTIPYNVADVYYCGGICWLHLQGRTVKSTLIWRQHVGTNVVLLEKILQPYFQFSTISHSYMAGERTYEMGARVRK